MFNGKIEKMGLIDFHVFIFGIDRFIFFVEYRLKRSKIKKRSFQNL